MIYRITALLILFSFSVCFGRPAQVDDKKKMVLTLEQAIELALKQNKDILVSKLDLRTAAEQIREARAGAFPKLDLTGRYTRNIMLPAFFMSFDGEVTKIEVGSPNAVNTQLMLTQPLYSGGRVGTAYKIAKIYSEASIESDDNIRNNTTLEVKKSFYGLLMAKEALKVAKRSLELSESHYNNIKKKQSQGVVSEYDLLRAEVQVANARPAVIQAENSLALGFTGFKNLLGIEPAVEVDIDGELKYDIVDEAEIKESSKDVYLKRPDYKNLDLMSKVYELNIKIEKGARLPFISLSGDYTFSGNSDNFTFGKNSRALSMAAYLNFSLSIFDGFKTSAKIQQARNNFRKMELQKAQLKEYINLEIEQTVLKMNEARKRIEAQGKTIQQAERALRISRVRYENGSGTQLDVFDVQVAYDVSQMNYIQAVYDYQVAKSEWEKAVAR